MKNNPNLCIHVAYEHACHNEHAYLCVCMVRSMHAMVHYTVRISFAYCNIVHKSMHQLAYRFAFRVHRDCADAQCIIFAFSFFFFIIVAMLAQSFVIHRTNETPNTR